jgi:glycosyltransferase involved in cell wall biosynthesis
MLFSIVIATYNQEHLVAEAVDSALHQTYRGSFEIIVIEDHSSDHTYQTLLKYGDRIRLVRNTSNCGATYGRNLGASMANGEYIVFLDGDDVLLPWALETYARVIEHRSPALLIGALLWCKHTIPDVSRGRYEGAIRFYEYDALVRKDRSQGGGASAIVVSREAFARSPGWQGDMWPMEVDDFCLYLGRESTVQLISPATTGYRIHGSNTFGDVPKFAKQMVHIVKNELDGHYPGGEKFRACRRAFIGSKLFYWVKNSVTAHHFILAVTLLWQGRGMLLTAISHRARAIVRGRHPAMVIVNAGLVQLYTDRYATRRMAAMPTLHAKH